MPGNVAHSVSNRESYLQSIKDDKFVSFNLVSIATEAGFLYQEVNFLKANNFPLDNIIINHLVPDFEEAVWEASATNKAVSLIKMEYDLQRPYRLKYEHLCEVEGLKLVGLYKVPFQPMGNRLNDFCKLVWNENGMEFECEKSYSITYTETGAELLLKIPNLDLIKCGSDGYKIDWNQYKYPSELKEYKFSKSRILKTGCKVIFTK